MNTFSRPGWDDYFLGIASAVAIRGDCTRSQVGAVLVDYFNKPLGFGFNGTTPGKPGCLSGNCPRGQRTYDELPPLGNYKNPVIPCIAIHAEHNALLNIPDRYPIDNPADRSWLLNKDARMYITREPCDDCKSLMASTGVMEAIWPNGRALLPFSF